MSREIAGFVIASEAKQSSLEQQLDCFVARASRNDEVNSLHPVK
jgi:hypothetical protein